MESRYAFHGNSKNKSSDYFRTFFNFVMRIFGKRALLRLKKKNVGNKTLIKAIDQLIKDLEQWDCRLTPIRTIRKDADCVHSSGGYFFDISIYRTLVWIDQGKDRAIVLWVGSHDEYVRVFKNNKTTILHWINNKKGLE